MSYSCYMCDAAAVSREHVPPLCFFPVGHRTNLFTVPSCDEHNAANSRDVEYVRNAISTQRGTNETADKLWETTKRSFDNSPKLFGRTFRDIRPVIVQGEETGSFTIDRRRFRPVIKAMAYALNYRDIGAKHRGDWQVFTASAHTADSLHHGKPDEWANFRRLLESEKLTTMPTPEPEVFKYSVLHMDENQILYRFEFYGGFVVNTWTLPVKLSPFIFQPVFNGTEGTIFLRSED